MILKIKEKISKQYKIKLLDLTEDFQGIDYNVFLPGDPVHPNVAGNKIIANKIIANKIFDYITSELNL